MLLCNSGLTASEYERLKQLSGTEPSGLLEVSAGYAEGSELTYLHGVVVDACDKVPDDLDVVDLDAGQWVLFRIPPSASVFRGL